MTPILETTSKPGPEDLDFVKLQLSAFNDADVGHSQRKTIAVFFRDADRAIVGALSGYTAWGWLYIQWLWVDEKYRGQKFAAKMLDAAEKEARLRGCHGALIDTFSAVAVKTYERQGYASFGELPDFPIGRNRVYLQKLL